MGKSGLAVLLAALSCGALTAVAAAQGTASGSFVAPPDEPLGTIALTDLTETRARPLFSPSRRPPAAPVLAALTSSPAIPAPRPKQPDHPLLTLLGTIVSESVEIGVFTDEASHDVIRLKAGDVHDGWTLCSIVGRTAVFQKEGYRAALLALPAPGSETAAPIGRAATPVVQPIAGVAPANTSEPAVNPPTTKGGWKREPREG